MEVFFYVFLMIISLTNLVLLFFMGAFIVRMNDKFTQMFSDLIKIYSDSPVEPPENDQIRSKSWDEKYEEDIESITKRIRIQSGLSDLPTVSSYDRPF
jgi:hypothetical protein